jgi:hypothetical protein
MNVFFTFLSMLAVVSAAVNPLGPYKVSDITVSGLSAGGFMAVQMHVAFSSIINGSAVFAGGPFYCAEGNLMTAEYKCMKTYEGLPNVDTLVTLTKNDAKVGTIDDTANLKDDRVYLFSGTEDSVVDPKVMDTLQTYYNFFVQPNNIVADFAVKAQHCFPTLAYGEACSQLSSPYIGKCQFDGASKAFSALFGTLNAKSTAVKANLMSFNQGPYFNDRHSSIGDTGYIYVPTACSSGASCRLHVALHGCLQTIDDIGNDFAAQIGMNEWAESNNIIVLYPYAKKSMSMPSNPNGCWDWWGYTDKSYGLKTGVQMQFVRQLIKEVSGV